MDFLDKYKYNKDDPSEFGIDIKKFKNNSNELDNSHLSNLLTNSVRVSKEILPKVGNAIETVFERIKIENNFNFFVTADNNQANASCSLMSSASRPDIILTSRLIELLSLEELQFVIGHEVAHYVYQHALYPNHNNVKDGNLKQPVDSIKETEFNENALVEKLEIDLDDEISTLTSSGANPTEASTKARKELEGSNSRLYGLQAHFVI